MNYKIQSGDTLSQIAARYGVDMYELARANNISNVNRIFAGRDLVIPDKQPAPTPQPVATPATKTTTPVIEERKSFYDVLPFDKVFDPELVNQMATGQINPEVQRERESSMNQLNTNLVGSGAYRTGRASTARRSLNDALDRSLKERVSSYTNTIKDLANEWYKTQYESYNKNPSVWKMPSLPTYEEFASSAGTPATSTQLSDSNNIQNMYNNIITTQ